MKTSGGIDEEPLGRCDMATGGHNITVYTYYERDTGKKEALGEGLFLKSFLVFVWNIYAVLTTRCLVKMKLSVSHTTHPLTKGLNSLGFAIIIRVPSLGGRGSI